jgi:hypothetical protein
MSSKTNKQTTMAEYFGALLKANERATTPGRLKPVWVARAVPSAEDVAGLVADEFGIYAITFVVLSEVGQTLPMLLDVPADGQTYRATKSYARPELNDDPAKLAEFWASLEAGKDQNDAPLALTRYQVLHSADPDISPAAVLRTRDGDEVWVSQRRMTLFHRDIDLLMAEYHFSQLSNKAVRVQRRDLITAQAVATVTQGYVMPVVREQPGRLKLVQDFPTFTIREPESEQAEQREEVSTHGPVATRTS